MKTTLLIISLFIATLQSCTSVENTEFQPTLPPITQTGENTFGCYVDGNLLVPRSGCSGGYL